MSAPSNASIVAALIAEMTPAQKIALPRFGALPMRLPAGVNPRTASALIDHGLIGVMGLAGKRRYYLQTLGAVVKWWVE